jgi:GNAT superfamily N-acetyltransferase
VTDQPLIRRATPADAEPAAHCHMACWREAYAGIVEPTLLAELATVETSLPRWRDQLAGGAERWIAEHPGGPDVPVADRVAGFAAPGMSRDTDAPTPLELYAIYVRRDWYGTGLGDRLLAAAIGKEPALLWVFEANARARAFYTRHGFRPDGARKDEPTFHQPEIRMVRGAVSADPEDAGQ